MEASKETINKIKKLSQIADSLNQGAWFSITRLTVLKSLCAERTVAVPFALALARLTSKRVETMPCQINLSPEEWKAHCRLIQLIAEKLETTELATGHAAKNQISDWLTQVRAVNNEFKPIKWGTVRVIRNRWVLVLEDVLQCLLRPEMSSDWSYKLARDYTEQYNPSYGTGLIPESEPMLRDIVDFFAGFYRLTIQSKKKEA